MKNVYANKLLLKETLEKAKGQPESLRQANLEPNITTPRLDQIVADRRGKRIYGFETDYVWGEVKDDLFRSACRGKRTGNVFEGKSKQPFVPKCHFVHHFDPYQKMGPFYLEVQLYRPLRSIIHDIFTEKEMNWMIEYSRPKLSSARIVDDGSTKFSKAEMKYTGNKGRSVAKTVQS